MGQNSVSRVLWLILVMACSLFSQDFILDAKDTIMYGTYYFNNFTMKNGATIIIAQFEAGTQKGKLTIYAQNITIGAGCTIQGVGKGNAGLSNVSWINGAGHGGWGGPGSCGATSSANTYGDSYSNFVNMGSKGQDGNSYGGYGGAAVCLWAQNCILLNGEINASGGSGGSVGYNSASGGGGSGGGILLNANQIIICGSLTANGGSPGGSDRGCPGGGGGGGRIKIFSNYKNILGQITVNVSYSGGNGTINFDRYPLEPQLISPRNNVLLNSTPIFRLMGSDPDSTNRLQYKIQVSRYYDFHEISYTYDQTNQLIGWTANIYNQNDTAKFIPPDPLPAGHYYWRASTFDGSVWSNGWNWQNPASTTYGEFTVTGNASSVLWQQTITATNNQGLIKTLEFGMAPGATNGIDPTLGEYELPPLPPSDIFDARFILQVPTQLYANIDIRDSSSTSKKWKILVQPGGSGLPVTLSWDRTMLPAGIFFLQDTSGGTTVNINMKQIGAFTITAGTMTSLQIVYTPPRWMSIPAKQNWSLYSLSINPSNPAAITVFPQSTAPVFWFNGTNGYIIQNTVTPGQGYWVKYPNDAMINILGDNVTDRSIPVKAGWNLVGPFADSVRTDSITTTGTVLSSPFYGYSNGYANASSLYSGKGYWVKVSADGSIILYHQAGLAKHGMPVTPIEINSTWNKLTLTDARMQKSVLYIANQPVIYSRYELPPLPPAGIFDARFSNESNVTGTNDESKELKLTSAIYPVTIHSDIPIYITDKATNGNLANQLITPDNALVVGNPAVTALLLKNLVVPATFAMEQNFPNPFNPVTTIKYSLAKKSFITITIYDALGRKIETLYSGEKEAGNYMIEWNAAKYASGVYLYQLCAPGIVFNKKAILVK
ncbi:MAG: T9SS type A sorting domain-containing protein [Ignavibacteria bacterium]|nr:T9SS type A sorting domain-containing protein [Ignavibacteria bacterium]